MTNVAPLPPLLPRLARLLALLPLLLLLAGPLARAQNAPPTFAAATSGNNFQPTSGTSLTRAVATDPATGNVYATGYFTGQVTFGSTRLVSAGNQDVFVAKWDASIQDWTSAVSGGGTGNDVGQGVAVSSAGGVTSVYVTGYFTSGTSASIAGTTLAGAGSNDVFVAKYTDPGTGLTTTNGGAVSGGGTGNDIGYGVAVSSAGGVNSVYVTGYFGSVSSASFAGTALNGAGNNDVFVAKYTDAGTGLTNTSGGAVSGGGGSGDIGYGVAVSSAGGTVSVYVTGVFTSGNNVSIAGTSLPGAGNNDVFVAKYTDAGTGLTSTNGGAVSGGGSSSDIGYGVAVSSAGGTTSVYVTGQVASGFGASIAGTPLAGAGSADVFVARYTDPGTGLTTTGGGAVSGGGPGIDQSYGVAVGGSTVYAGGVVGNTVASFGGSPVRRAPLSSAVLARLDAGSLGYLGIEGPLQGGASFTQAMATDPATGNVYAVGYFTGTVAFGNTRLVSVGSNDVFVAKWDAAAQAWTSAVSGGGTGSDVGLGVAVSSAGGVASVYVTGYFASGSSASIAGTTLPGTSNADMFVAKYTDAGTGLTTTNGGAVSGGGTGNDVGNGVAVSSTGGVVSVYVTGQFASGTSASIAGTALAGAGLQDVFVAKYTDAGTGLTTTNGGAVSGGGTSFDVGLGVAVSSAGGTASVYVTGYFASSSSANIAGTVLAGAGSNDLFVARYTDAGSGLTNTDGGAVSDGGIGDDRGQGVAVRSAGGVASVYVTGYFASGASASLAGTALTGAGNADLFVAKYTDAGTGLTSTGGGAVSGGGTSNDYGYGVAIAGQRVYVGGYTTPSATFGATTLANPAATSINVLARLTDNTLTPLPVQLVSFTATASGPAAVRLTWATASEQNSARFEVQRSPDGTVWATLGSVAAAGSSVSARQYAYLDGAAPAGTSYYRLRQVDQDGSATHSPVRAVTRGAATLSLYPNPAPGGAATLTGATPGAAVQVRDALGRVVTTATVGADGTAALGGLAPGLYVVRAGAGSARLAVK